MALNDAMYTGVNNIMAAFDTQAQTPFFSVWKNKDLLFSFNESDKEAARAYLHDNFLAAEQNQVRDVLKIKFHPKKEKGFITDKTEVIGCMYVRVCHWDPQEYSRNYREYQGQGNNAILESLKAIESRLTAIEGEEEQEEQEGAGVGAMDDIGRIQSILENPITQRIMNAPLLKGFIGQILGESLQPPPGQQLRPSISGIRNKELLDKAIQMLSEADDNIENDLYKLAQVAKNNPDEFNGFLQMLRAM